MAIKTKKIVDLEKIEISTGAETKDSVYLLGTDGDKTGKISYKQIVEKIDSKIESAVKKSQEEVEQTPKSRGVDESAAINNEIKAIKTSVSTINSSLKTTNTKVSSNESKIKVLEEKIATLETKVVALESFVQALQKDGYLTLKEIQRAAAEACPICNHTHEEQSAE